MKERLVKKYSELFWKAKERDELCQRRVRFLEMKELHLKMHKDKDSSLARKNYIRTIRLPIPTKTIPIPIEFGLL
jgi:hypothetical protein